MLTSAATQPLAPSRIVDSTGCIEATDDDSPGGSHASTQTWAFASQPERPVTAPHRGGQRAEQCLNVISDGDASNSGPPGAWAAQRPAARVLFGASPRSELMAWLAHAERLQVRARRCRLGLGITDHWLCLCHLVHGPCGAPVVGATLLLTFACSLTVAAAHNNARYSRRVARHGGTVPGPAKLFAPRNGTTRNLQGLSSAKRSKPTEP